MAGAGFRTFVDGEVLTAAQVNTYLMQQSVMVFADASARSTAIAAPSEGMVTYLTGTDVLEYYDGAAWQPILDQDVIAAKGDLIVGTADDTVQALTVGSNEQRLVADSGETTGLKYVADTTNYAIGAKGDLLVGTAADTLTNLAVGTNGYVLTADSAETSGVKWAASASGASANDTDTVSTSENTTSSSFTDLATAGPAVTLTTGTKALVIVTARCGTTTVGYTAYMSFAVSGATTRSAQSAESVFHRPSGSNGQSTIRASAVTLVTGLTAGSNTFTAKYRVDAGGTANFENRAITVIDMGS